MLAALCVCVCASSPKSCGDGQRLVAITSVITRQYEILQGRDFPISLNTWGSRWIALPLNPADSTLYGVPSSHKFVPIIIPYTGKSISFTNSALEESKYAPRLDAWNAIPTKGDWKQCGRGTGVDITSLMYYLSQYSTGWWFGIFGCRITIGSWFL